MPSPFNAALDCLLPPAALYWVRSVKRAIMFEPPLAWPYGETAAPEAGPASQPIDDGRPIQDIAIERYKRRQLPSPDLYYTYEDVLHRCRAGDRQDIDALHSVHQWVSRLWRHCRIWHDGRLHRKSPRHIDGASTCNASHSARMRPAKIHSGSCGCSTVFRGCRKSRLPWIKHHHMSYPARGPREDVRCWPQPSWASGSARSFHHIGSRSMTGLVRGHRVDVAAGNTIRDDPFRW